MCINWQDKTIAGLAVIVESRDAVIKELEQQLVAAEKGAKLQAILASGWEIDARARRAENVKYKAALEKIKKQGNKMHVNPKISEMYYLLKVIDDSQALTEPEPECKTCGGGGKVSSQTSEQINVFGHLMPCPACQPEDKEEEE